MSNTFYFSHDMATRSDIKIKRLVAKHGLAGYGCFWAIIEDLYQNANALPTDYDSIAFDMHADSELVKSVVNDFGLFEIANDYFGSLSVERRLEERNKKSTNAQKSARYRWDRKDTDANALPTQCNSNAIKGKESIVKEKKEKKILSIKSNEDILEQFKTHYRTEWNKAVEAKNAETDQEKAYQLKKAVDFLTKISRYIVDNELNFVASMQGQFTLKGIMQNKELLDTELVISKLLGVETSDVVKAKKAPTLNLTVMNWIKRDANKPIG